MVIDVTAAASTKRFALILEAMMVGISWKSVAENRSSSAKAVNVRIPRSLIGWSLGQLPIHTAYWIRYLIDAWH